MKDIVKIDVWDDNLQSWLDLIHSLGISYKAGKKRPIKEDLLYITQSGDTSYEPQTIIRYSMSRDDFNLLVISKPVELWLSRNKRTKIWTLNQTDDFGRTPGCWPNEEFI
jgi:hypothetical protein